MELGNWLQSLSGDQQKKLLFYSFGRFLIWVICPFIRFDTKIWQSKLGCSWQIRNKQILIVQHKLKNLRLMRLKYLRTKEMQFSNKSSSSYYYKLYSGSKRSLMRKKSNYIVGVEKINNTDWVIKIFCFYLQKIFVIIWIVEKYFWLDNVKVIKTN